MQNRIFLGLLSVLALGLAGCSDDGGDSGSGGSGGSGGGDPGCPEVDNTGCGITISPADSASATYDRVQAALQDAESDSTVCLCPGEYPLDRELSLNKLNVSIKGLGASRSDVLLNFAPQTSGDDGLYVTSDGFTIENLAVRNSPGNGIVVDGAEDVVFRNLEVSWDAGSVTENGAYAVYPVSSTRVTVEDSLVVGAADAGIYVGQCNDVIVRRNEVHGNVAGIEIENSTNAEVYENEAYDNTSGILVFVLPNLEKKDGLKTLVRDNHVHDNNRANFAEPGTIVANVPPGTGMLLLAADETEVRNNTIENNDSTGVLVLSMNTVELLVGPSDDPNTDPYPEQNFIHDNTFSNNGTSPQSVLGEWGVVPLEDVVWDGTIDTAKTLEPLCLGAPPFPTYRNVHAPGGLVDVADHTTDTAEVECTLPAHPGTSF